MVRRIPDRKLFLFFLPALFYHHSTPSLSPRRDSGPPIAESLFPEHAKEREKRPTGKKDGEREREEGLSEARILFFFSLRFLEQVGSHWTPPGSGNVSIRDLEKER